MQSRTSREPAGMAGEMVFVRRASILLCLAILVVLISALSLTGSASAAGKATLVPGAPAAGELGVAISGRFQDFTTGQVIGGARVTIVKQDGTRAGTAVADAAGDFELTVETVAGGELTAVYEAAGYLREESVVRATGPSLTLSPLLTPRGVKEAVLYSLPRTLAGRQSATVSLAGAAATPALAATAAVSTVAAAALTTPATIRVYRESLGIVQVVPFNFYCKHVLPSEWLPYWPVESLRAGAMAVKEYAWYYVSIGGKWKSLGADVKDGWTDQKYDPNRSAASTDAAVDYIWSSYLLRNGALFPVTYCGDNYLNANYRCPDHLSRMPQWGTFYLARDKGWDWQQIIHYYWDPVIITSGSPSDGSTRYEQTNGNIARTGTWEDYLKTGASGGSYGRSSTAGAAATIYFTGTKIAWIGMKGTTTGIVDVYLDSTTTKTTTIDLTATSASYNVTLWTSPTLTNGAHYLRLVRATGSASGKFMTLDAVDIWGNISAAPPPGGGSTRYEQTNGYIARTGTWEDYLKTGASGGSYGRSSTAGATATIYFTGTKIAWVGMKGTTTGMVDVYLDSTTTKTTTIDLTATTASYNLTLWTSPTLTNTTHYLRLVRSTSSATGKFMTLDAVDIWGSIKAGP